MMKHNRYLFGLALLVAGALPAFSQVSNDNEDGVYKVDHRIARDFVPGQVLVKFKDASSVQVRRNAKGQFKTASLNSVDQLLKEFGAEDMEKLFPNEEAKSASNLRSRRAPNGSIVKERNLDKVFLVQIASERPDSTMMLIERLKAMPDVEYAEPNYKVYITADMPSGIMSSEPAQPQKANRAPVSIETNATTICPSPNQNPLYFRQYGITQQNIHKLWNKTIINKKRPVIAILDTGVDITHPDLAANIWTNTAEAEGETAYDDDGNGIVDDKYGWNFVDNYGDLTDRNGHGTHVAGIAAAVNNNIGIVGANPLALIMPVKVMNDRGVGDGATIARGIVYAAENGADVLNMSFGTSVLSNTMKNALDMAYQTSILVASAGNDGKSIYDMTNPPGTSYPAAYYLVLGVEASASNLQRASYSNYDPDGPIYSEDGIDGRNYEIQVPGDKIYSTLPGGKYNQLSGTSMSTPLLAGAISALMMVKDYPSKDILFGDLIHLNADFEKIYNDETPRSPKIELVAIEMDDNVNSNTNVDGQVDVGETIKIYPVLRNTWADATNIKLKLTVDNAYQNFVDILNSQVDFGYSISAYGRQMAQTPILVMLGNNIGNNTRVKFCLEISCHENAEPVQQDFYITVNNMVKISGLISEDRTLTADHIWHVTSNLAIPEGVTLTIEPGTTILFNEGVGISNSGTLIANGTPGKMITLTKSEEAQKWDYIRNANLSYCRIYYAYMGFNGTVSEGLGNFENCEIKYSRLYFPLYKINQLIRSNYLENSQNAYTFKGSMLCSISKSNIINNTPSNIISEPEYSIRWSTLHNANFFNNGKYQLGGYSNSPQIYTNENPSYLGSANIDIVSKDMCDINNGFGYATTDLSNMLTEPVADAHGIVWKVCVNGKDAQDEYEDLAPLGVGKHKFEVYFNRPMNKNVTPQISFGLRDPYTQNAVAEDGSWNEEGTIYTAYKTITGKTKSDGVNRIYVWGAEDDEFFEIPYEKTRFNVMINAAGSMATGFAGEAGLGRVNLTWNNENNDFEDAMGFNIYRYQLDNDNNEVNNTCINKEIVDIETTEYTDYDVIPGQTYYYMYKVLSTDLKEYDVSNVVAVTPLTATLGDANGSGDVDVADVITTVNYAAGMEPKPFIFEAADMNTDQTIDILDVVGIIQKILNPGAREDAMLEATATYTIENDVLYVETPIALAGVQVQLNMDEKRDVMATETLNGFEQVSAWLSDNDMLFLAYNMNGKTLAAGKHALLKIGNAEVSTLRLSDSQGRNVMVEAGNGTTGIDALGSKVQLQGGIFNLKGQKVSGKAVDLQKLPKGVYIINGEKIVK